MARGLPLGASEFHYQTLLYRLPQLYREYQVSRGKHYRPVALDDWIGVGGGHSSVGADLTPALQ